MQIIPQKANFKLQNNKYYCHLKREKRWGEGGRKAGRKEEKTTWM